MAKASTLCVLVFVLCLCTVAQARKAAKAKELSLERGHAAAMSKAGAKASPAGKPCESYEYCMFCAKDPNCGWCNGACLPGTKLGPLYSNCTAPNVWDYDFCSAEPCSDHRECGDCIEDPLCGFCATNGRCTDGNIDGSVIEDCEDLKVAIRGQTITVNAWNHQDKEGSCSGYKTKITGTVSTASKQGKNANPSPEDLVYIPPDEYLHSDADDSAMAAPPDTTNVGASGFDIADMSNRLTPPPQHGEAVPVLQEPKIKMNKRLKAGMEWQINMRAALHEPQVSRQTTTTMLRSVTNPQLLANITRDAMLANETMFGNFTKGRVNGSLKGFNGTNFNGSMNANNNTASRNGTQSSNSNNNNNNSTSSSVRPSRF